MATGLKSGTNTGEVEEFDFLEPQRRWRLIVKALGGVLPALALVGFIASGDGDGAGELRANSGPEQAKPAVAASSKTLPSLAIADPVVNGSDHASAAEPPPERPQALGPASAQQAPHKRKASKPAARRRKR